LATPTRHAKSSDSIACAGVSISTRHADFQASRIEWWYSSQAKAIGAQGGDPGGVGRDQLNRAGAGFDRAAEQASGLHPVVERWLRYNKFFGPFADRGGGPIDYRAEAIFPIARYYGATATRCRNSFEISVG
jgi:hypothetical protein